MNSEQRCLGSVSMLFGAACTIGLCLLAGPALAGQGDEGQDASNSWTGSWRVLCPGKDGDLDDCGLLRQRGGYLGVELLDLTPELRRHFGVPEDAGVMVSRVAPDSPAAAAGLAPGDVVTRLDGDDVASTWDLSRRVRAHGDGEAVDLEYYRDGRLGTVSVTLEERERHAFDLGELAIANAKRLKDLGVDRAALDEAMRRSRQVMAGVDWRRYMDRPDRSDTERLEGRIEELQKRLEELEARLSREIESEKRGH